MDAKRWRPEAEAYLSEAAADIGDALADVAVVMHRTVQKVEEMKARASEFEGPHNTDTFGGATAAGRDLTSPPAPRPPNDTTDSADETGPVAGQEAAREELT